MDGSDGNVNGWIALAVARGPNWVCERLNANLDTWCECRSGIFGAARHPPLQYSSAPFRAFLCTGCVPGADASPGSGLAVRFVILRPNLGLHALRVCADPRARARDA